MVTKNSSTLTVTLPSEREITLTRNIVHHKAIIHLFPKWAQHKIFCFRRKRHGRFCCCRCFSDDPISR